MTPPALAGLELILGRCDDMRAEVFVRLPLGHPPLPPGEERGDGASAARPLRLAGTLTGPECRRGWTLPTTARFADRGSGPPGESAAVVARAILTEPSFWTPELPGLYRLDVQLVDGDLDRETVVASDRRLVGLRRSGIRGTSLWLEGRRWVPRGVVCTAAEFSPALLRQAAATAVIVDPPAALLAEADAEGVAVIAVLADATGQPLGVAAALERLTAWAWHPAVVMAVVPKGGPVEPLATAARRRKGTILLAGVVAGAEPRPSGFDGLDAVIVELAAGAVPHAEWLGGVPLPLIAWWHDAGHGAATAIDDRRRACDRLQAALASWGIAAGDSPRSWDWAGYLIG
jgi:hypothetical protein